jgi:hypothetical protein
VATLSAEIFVLCDYASISQDQKLSIHGIFDQFHVANLPINWPRMFLVAALKGEPGQEYSLNLKLTPPQKTDQDLPAKEMKLTLGSNGQANLITELVNFPLATAGVYKFELMDSNQPVAQRQFSVTKTTATYQGQDQLGKKVAN